MYIAKIGRRGQITLPRAIRRSTGIQEGDRVVFLPQGNQILICPIMQTLTDLRGSIPVKEEQDFPAIRQQVILDHIRQEDDHAG